MNELTLFAQADVIEVILELTSTESAAEIEQLVMRAIDSGVDDYHTLSVLFGLTPRLTADLLGDLWTAGRISLDLGMTPETIALSDEGRKHLSSQSQRDAARTSTSTSKVLLERLTGRVLAEHAGMRSVDRSLVIPVMTDDRERRQVRTPELVEAVRQNLERSDDELGYMNGQRIASVRSKPNPARITAERVLVPIRTSIWRDGDTLHVHVIDQNLSLDARQLAARRLEEYLRENPETGFSRTVRARAQQLADRVRTADMLLAELGSGVVDLAHTDPGVRQSENDRLRTIANQLADQAASLAAREMDVTLTVDTDEHIAAIRRLLESAQVQAVIAVPRISEKMLLLYRAELEAAVARGVRVFIIWGLKQADASLDAHITRLLYEISRRGTGGGGIRFAAASAHSHAKVLIADDRSALVTSKNFLSVSAFREIGVVVSASPDRPAPVIEELLGWAGRVMPDFEIAQQILRSADEFGGRSTSPVVSLPIIPDYESDLGEAPVGDPKVEIWAAEWQGVVADLRAALHRQRPVVRPLHDGLHHSLVRELLGEVRHRMIVASHRLAIPVIARDLASRADSARNRGASVELIYGELEATTEPEDVARLLEHEAGSQVEVRERAENHAKVLVADDVSVIGSFNYLSFGGVSRRGMSSEVSLEIASWTLADRLAQTLGSKASQLIRESDSESAPLISAPFSVARQLATEFRAGRLTISSAMEALMDVTADDVLAALKAAGDEPTEQALLSALVAAEVSTGRERWLQDLMNSAATRGDWFAAFAFRSDLQLPSTAAPPIEVVSAIAADSEGLAEVICRLDGSTGDIDPLSLHMAAELLTSSRVDLRSALEHWSPAMSAGTQVIVSAVLAHAYRFGGYDREAVRAEQLRNSSEEDQATGWVRLEETVQRLHDVDVRVLAGRRTIDHVFSPGEEFAAVSPILATRDVRALEAWLESHEPDDFAWVDQSAKAAGAPQIIAGLRERFASRRGQVRQAARDVLIAASSTIPLARPLQPGELDSLAEISALVANTSPVVTSPYGSALGALALSRLAGLAEGGSATQGSPSWRFPRLARVGSVTPDERATLAARDLFEVRSPGEAIRALCDVGDIPLASFLLQDLVSTQEVDDEDAARLERMIEIERERQAQALTVRVDRILARAQVLEVDTPTAEQVRRDELDLGAELESLLTEEELLLDLAEMEQREQLEVDLAAMPSQDGSRREYVRQLLAAGEFTTARDVIANPSSHDLRLWTQPTFPWLGWSLADVCRRFDNPFERPPGFEKFVPTDDDARGWRVVAAMRALLGNEDDASVVGEYVAALQHLIMPDAATPIVEPGLGDATVEFLLPSLPHLQWGYEPVQVAVGHSEASGLFRIATTIESDSGDPVLHISDVLTLLHSPDPESRLEIRRLSFLRIIASRLAVDDVFDDSTIGLGAEPLSLDATGRLLNVLGVDVARSERETIYGLLGTHPYVFWNVVEWARSEAEGAIRFSQLRTRPDFDEQVVEMIHRDLASSPALVTLAMLAEYGERNGATAEDLRALIRAEASDVSADPLPEGLEIVDVDSALITLVENRYVERGQDGMYRAKPNAPWYSIRRTFRLGWFEAALLSSIRTAQSDFAQKFDHDLLRHLLHHWRGVAVEAGEANEREVRLAISDMKDAAVPVNVQNLLHVVQRTYGGPKSVYLGIGAVDPKITIDGPFAQLAVLIGTALQNSVQAIRRHAGAENLNSYIRIDVTTQPDVVAIRIRDSGPGFPASTLDAYRAGRQVASSNGDEPGHGLGIFLAFDKYWGKVELANADDGGAIVEVTASRREDEAAPTEPKSSRR